MKLEETTQSEFERIVVKPFTVFDSSKFSALNSKKVEEVKYLIFTDSKIRFGLIAGIKDKTLKIPFSAPYGCFSKVSKQSKILSYSTSVKSLVDLCQQLQISKIRITLPPLIYDSNHISKLYNSFYVNKFQIAGCDLNYHFNLSLFDQTYLENMDIKAKQKLRTSMKSNLSFKKTSDYKTVYELISQNRKENNYPLWMTLENVAETIKVIPADFFTVNDAHNNAVAGCMTYHISPEVVQVIHWGSLAIFDNLKPMNFLAFKIFEFYSTLKIKIIDTGPATEFSIPNYGLCDFKQSIGCKTSIKLSFELKL